MSRPPSAPVVTIYNGCLSYATASGPLAVLKGVDLRIGPGESIALLGPSGSGKTTLLNVLACRMLLDAGAVTLLGCDPAACADDARAVLRQQVGMVDQGSPLISSLNVLENVLAPLVGLPRSPALLAEARRLLEQLELAENIHRHPSALSGGERQRTVIARALLGQPALLLADEPTSNQDSARTAVVVDLLLAHAARGHAVVVGTHDLAVAARASRAYRLEDGRIIPIAIRRGVAPQAATVEDEKTLGKQRAGSDAVAASQAPTMGPATASARPATGDDATASARPATGGAARAALQVIDLDQPISVAEQAVEAPETAAATAVSVRHRRAAPTDLARVALFVLAALLLGSGGGSAVRAYLAARQAQAASLAAARALALEQQADLRDPEWPQFLHDPTHSGSVVGAIGLAGRRAWVHRMVGPVISSPVVSGGVVFVGGTDGYLHAIDARTGRELWRFSTGGELVNSTPAVHGGLVYINVSGNLLFALDRRNGRPRWSASLGGLPSAPPVVAGGLVLAATGSYTLQALDAASGRRRWLVYPPVMHHSGYPTEGAATVRDGVVYETFGAAGSFVALRLRDGHLLWQFGPFGERLAGTPAVDTGAVYFEMWRGIVVALDRARHTLRWWTLLPPTRGQGLDAALVRVRDLLLAPDLDGRLYALSSVTGRVRWHVTTGGALLSAPALSGNRAYLASTDGRLYAIDTRTGAVLWTMAIGESRGTPALGAGRLYAGSLDPGGAAGEGAVIAIQ